MIDRLGELQSLNENPSSYIPPLISNSPSQLYLQKIKSAQHCLYKVKKVTFQIRELKKTFVVTATIEEESSLKVKLRDFVNFNNNELNKVRKFSETLNEEIASANELDDADYRIKTTMQATLMKQFQEAVADSEKAQSEFNDYAHEKISGQIRMIDENIDDDSIEKIIEDPTLAKALVESQLIGGHGDIIRMVNRIEDRLEDIKMLEQNIIIMHRMFLDLAVLVESQGDILNSIEDHVDKAKDYVIQGTQAIENAQEQLKSARWKKCCLLMIVLVIGIIIAVPIITVKSI